VVHHADFPLAKKKHLKKIDNVSSSSQVSAAQARTHNAEALTEQVHFSCLN